MKKIFTAVLALSATLSCHATFAAPGEYWEVTSKMEMPGMPFAMPATTSKVCMSKGQEHDPQKSSGDKSCEMTDVKTVGNKTSWKMRCNRDGEVMTGSGEQTTSANSYDGKMQFTSSNQKSSGNMTIAFSGKRIGGNCDTEEVARKAQASAQKAHAELCDPAGWRTPHDTMAAAYMTLGNTPQCPEQRNELCNRVRRDAPRDADTYVALQEHEKSLIAGANASIVQGCKLNMDAITKSVCKTISSSNYEHLSGYCPAEAKAFREAQRRKECEGREYSAETRAEDLKRCLEGKGPKGSRSFTADDNAAQKSGDSKSSSTSGQILDGAKKLKGLFGF